MLRPWLNAPIATLTAVTLLIASVAACGGSDFVDTDHTAKTALGLPTELTVEGALDVERGDATDWKRFTAEKDGTATLSVRVGDPFEGRHTVTGSIVVFDRDARQLTSEAIANHTVKYELSWDVEAEVQYLVRMTASAGKSTYAMDLVTEGGDDCANITCEPGEHCEDGECIDPNICEPACGSGRYCVDGECVRKAKPSAQPCGGKKCPRGKYCSSAKNRCVKDPCHGKRCGAGEVCRRGVCKPKATRKPPRGACDPPCTDGAKCSKGKCKLGPVSARIVQSVARGETTMITLSKGKTHKIKKGQTGKVSGVGSFKIIDVFESRSKAVLRAPLSKLGQKKSATIYR